jgi:hypothetical protein
MRAFVLAAILFLLAPAAFAQTFSSPQISIESGPCCAAGGSDFDRLFAAEPQVLAALPDLALRRGRTLSLKLGNNRTLTLVDCGFPDLPCKESGLNTQLHVLTSFWAKHGYYVVSLLYYESQRGLLIRESDGAMWQVAAPPILSPDGQYAIASDVSATGGSGGTEMLDLRTDAPRFFAIEVSPNCHRDFKKLITPGGGERWIDTKHVLFPNSLFSDDSKNPKELLLRIVDGKSEWECRD